MRDAYVHLDVHYAMYLRMHIHMLEYVSSFDISYFHIESSVCVYVLCHTCDVPVNVKCKYVQP
jgi:hypothetical protein